MMNTEAMILDHPRHSGRGLMQLVLALILLPWLLIACSGDSGPVDPTPVPPPSSGPPPGTGNPANPSDGFLGVYRLSTVNGHSLSQPYVQYDLGMGTWGKQYVEAGSIIFEDDGSFHILLEVALTIGDGPRVRSTKTFAGTWQFKPASSGDVSGPIELTIGAEKRTVLATPYTITATEHLDPFKDGHEQLIYVKE